MLEAEPDAEMDRRGGAGHRSALRDELEAFRLRSLLSGPDDFRDAQVEISAGAGGTEAQDWAQMLMRMYTRWAERRGYTVEILDLSDGEEAGIKGAVLEIKGAVRLRIPEGRKRASTGWCASRRSTRRRGGTRASRRSSCTRWWTTTINIEIRDEDIKMDVFRASGAGGQHVNKTSSAVRLTHIPSGHRRVVAAGAVAAQEQADGDEDAQEPPVPARGGEAGEEEGRSSTRRRPM